jgi:ABC-type proline/glycine betaine transport system ATPase subunit
LRRQFGKTAMFVTHDVREALSLASRIAVLANGALDFVGTPQEFLKAHTAEAKAFLACLQPLEVSCR